MEQNNINLGAILGDMGCKFRSNIENNIKDYELQKEDEVEWLLEPLDAISHSADLVLDAFKNGWEALFPKGWHANYMKKIYVFSKADKQQIIDKFKNRFNDLYDFKRLASLLDCDEIMPSVEINGNKAVASYYYWNNWSGFCRRIIPIERQGQSVSFGESEREVLVKYDCGIRY